LKIPFLAAHASNVQANADFAIWNGVVEYSHAVMEAVRVQAVNGFNSFGHGGMEIGGVLYGEKRGDVVRVLASQELECEHAYGPGFLLSEKDELRFRELMKPRDGMRAVGWYASHTRSGVVMSANDCAIMERFFGDRGSVALLMKPTRHGPAEATFYIQGNAEPGPHFTVLVPRAAARPHPAESEPVAKPERPAPVPVPALAPAPPIAPVPAVAAPVPPSPVLIPAKAKVVTLPGTPSRYVPSLRWVGIGMALAAFGTWFISWRPEPKASAAARQIGLQVLAIADRQVKVQWDWSSPAVRNAPAGTLEITDGPQKYSVPLSGVQLRSSSLTYSRQTDAVDVQLSLATGVVESVHMIAPAPPPVAPAPAPAVVHAAQPKPEAGPSAPPTRTEKVSAVDAREREPAQATAPLRRFTLVTEERKATGVALPDPPPVTGATVRTPLIAMVPKLPVPAPVAAPAATSGASAPVVKTARSGRMIWTGTLERRGVVEFEGASATFGSLSGGLPGAPVKLLVYPAEFKNDGLIVYVTDATRHNRSEAPGPMTGWNRLHFVWDPERVKQMSVLEAPNAGNQFSRLVLRNNARSCSVVVVEWKTE
jgi:hypothetical protein